MKTALALFLAATLNAHASPCANSLNSRADTSRFEFAVPPISGLGTATPGGDAETELVGLVQTQLRGISLGNTFTMDFRVMDGVLLVAITGLDPRLRMPLARALLNRWDLIELLQKLEQPLHLEFTPEE